MLDGDRKAWFNLGVSIKEAFATGAIGPKDERGNSLGPTVHFLDRKRRDEIHKQAVVETAAQFGMAVVHDVSGEEFVLG
jgi:hypothetical protein